MWETPGQVTGFWASSQAGLLPAQDASLCPASQRPPNVMSGPDLEMEGEGPPA